jgi:hypothetical protein
LKRAKAGALPIMQRAAARINDAFTGPISPGSFLPVTFAWLSYDVQVVRTGLSYNF